VASVGADIAEVYVELGTLVTILRTPTNLTGYIIHDVNMQSSRPMAREHMLEPFLPFDTPIVTGDIIQFNGGSYIVSHKTADMFENATVEYASTIFKCNVPTTAVLFLNYADVVNTKVCTLWILV
jgi:hypothetical protein